MASENPFEAPKADLAAPPGAILGGKAYGGIGRGAYFGLSFLVGIVAGALAAALPEDAAAGALAITLGQVAAIVAIAGQRIKNLGMSPWWGLTILVPLYNIIVSIRCLAYPEGWADHRRLDGPGKVIVGLIAAFIILLVLLLGMLVIGGSAMAR